ncbi:MAG: glycosyltransferase [Candidatus Acidiferrales bacterium]
MSSPKISVVMSVYNGEVFLAEAVESVLAQSFADFEFIIIDDGSTDRAPEILSGYARRDARVRVFPQQNKGRPESLNRGIEISTAPLIARMDADDISMPRRVEQQVKLMEARPEVALLGGPVEFIGHDGARIGGFRPPETDAEIRIKMLHTNVFYHPTVMMRREHVLAAGGYRKALLDADDYDLFLRMAERGEMAALAEPVLAYRVHPNQASVANLMVQTRCLVAARKAASLRDRGLPDPLCGVEEISPEFVRQLGVSDEEVRAYAAGAHVNWIGLLAEVYPDSALRLVDSLLELCDSGSFERSAVAAALFRAAGIHFRQGRYAEGLASVCRSVSIQPIEAGRHLKWAIARRVAQFSHANR